MVNVHDSTLTTKNTKTHLTFARPFCGLTSQEFHILEGVRPFISNLLSLIYK